MKGQFQICGGSMIGADHVRLKKNNQDTFLWEIKENILVAVVADGCGSQPDSEVGSKIISRLLVKKILDIFSANPSWEHEKILACAREELLFDLEILGSRLGEDFHTTVFNLFLSTLIGTLITEVQASIFSIGDGYYALNGKVVSLGPLPENAPPYLAYGLLNTYWNPKDIQFKIQRKLPAEAVKSILIGTDGVEYLLKNEKSCYPGKGGLIGPISQFWENDAFFNNPDQIRRTLALMNREEIQIDWETKRVHKCRPLLLDDTTLIVIRRSL